MTNIEKYIFYKVKKLELTEADLQNENSLLSWIRTTIDEQGSNYAKLYNLERYKFMYRLCDYEVFTKLYIFYDLKNHKDFLTVEENVSRRKDSLKKSR